MAPPRPSIIGDAALHPGMALGLFVRGLVWPSVRKPGNALVDGCLLECHPTNHDAGDLQLGA